MGAGHGRVLVAYHSEPRDWAVIVTLCVSISYLDSGLLGGDVALDLAEFLLKSCQTGLNQLLLGHRRKEKCVIQALIGNSGFLGASLWCAEVGCVKINCAPLLLSKPVTSARNFFSADLVIAEV